MLNILDPQTKKPRLQAKECATCGFGPTHANLRPRRLKELIRENTGDGKMGLVCHETIEYSTDDDGNETAGGPGNALCRGFYDRFGHLANGIRIMERLGGFTEVQPKESRSNEHAKS